MVDKYQAGSMGSVDWGPTSYTTFVRLKMYPIFLFSLFDSSGVGKVCESEKGCILSMLLPIQLCDLPRGLAAILYRGLGSLTTTSYLIE
jgi:hypothetical protein